MSTQDTIIPVVLNTEGHTLTIQGPDIWLFPEIDGCYAVRQTPHRWGGSVDSNITYIYGYNGQAIGEYHEFMSGKIVSSVTYLIDRKQKRLDISIENATRFCYLFMQNYISEGIRVFPNRFPDALVYSEDKKFFAVLIGFTGYAIFNDSGEMIGHLKGGDRATYYPKTQAIDRLSIKMSRSRNELKRYPKLPTSTNEIRPMLDTAFDFINRCE